MVTGALSPAFASPSGAFASPSGAVVSPSGAVVSPSASFTSSSAPSGRSFARRRTTTQRRAGRGSACGCASAVPSTVASSGASITGGGAGFRPGGLPRRRGAGDSDPAVRDLGLTRGGSVGAQGLELAEGPVGVQGLGGIVGLRAGVG